MLYTPSLYTLQHKKTLIKKLREPIEYNVDENKKLIISFNHIDMIEFHYVIVKDIDHIDDRTYDEYNIVSIYYNEEYTDKIDELLSRYYDDYWNTINISILEIMNILILKYDMSIEFIQTHYKSNIENLDFSENILDRKHSHINIELKDTYINSEIINNFNLIIDSSLNKITLTSINEINFINSGVDTNFLESIQYNNFKNIKSTDSKILYFLYNISDNITYGSELTSYTLNDNIPELNIFEDQSKEKLLSEIYAFYNITSVILYNCKINDKKYTFYIIKKKLLTHDEKQQKHDARTILLELKDKQIKSQDIILEEYRNVEKYYTIINQEYINSIKCKYQSIIIPNGGNGCWLYSSIAAIFFTDLSYKYIIALRNGLLFTSNINNFDNNNISYNIDKKPITDINLTNKYIIKVLLNKENIIIFNINGDTIQEDDFYKIPISYNSTSKSKNVLSDINSSIDNTEITIVIIKELTSKKIHIKRIYKKTKDSLKNEPIIYFNNSDNYTDITEIYISVKSLTNYNLIDLDIRNIIFFRNINYNKIEKTDGDIRGYVIETNISKEVVTDYPDKFGDAGIKGGKYTSGISYIFKFLDRITNSETMIESNQNIINLKVINIIFLEHGFKYSNKLYKTSDTKYILYTDIMRNKTKNESYFEKILKGIILEKKIISNILLIYTISNEVNDLLSGSSEEDLFSVPFIFENYQLGSAGFSCNKFDPISKNISEITTKKGHAISGFFCNGNQFILDTAQQNRIDINFNDIKDINIIEKGFVTKDIPNYVKSLSTEISSNFVFEFNKKKFIEMLNIN